MGGVLLGIVLGIVGAVTVPDLLPDNPPDCVEPERVVWSREGTGLRIELEYPEDGSNGCDASVVFREPATQADAR